MFGQPKLRVLSELQKVVVAFPTRSTLCCERKLVIRTIQTHRHHLNESSDEHFEPAKSAGQKDYRLSAAESDGGG